MKNLNSISLFLKRGIHKIIHPVMINKSKICKQSKVGCGSYIFHSSIDKYSYIGENCHIIHCDIGKFSSIADNCSIGGANHPTDWITTSPLFLSGKNILKRHFAFITYQPYKTTIIGNDVWVGDKALIKSGITIGDGAIIGMGSVVTKNVGPYEIWAGNPASIIKKRFPEDIIKKLVEVKWWTWSDDQIKKYAYLFSSPDLFLKELGKT